jgi:hypothetical protein
LASCLQANCERVLFTLVERNFPATPGQGPADGAWNRVGRGPPGQGTGGRIVMDISYLRLK